MADRAALVCGNWVDALQTRFELVLCNPPYIPTSDLSGLMPEVARYEPRSALDGGPDGLAAYRTLVPHLPRLLDLDGVALVELGAGQADEVAALAREVGLAHELRHDLSGIARVLVLRRVLP